MHPTSAPEHRPRRGVTLVEILVAIIMLVVALGGALGTAGAVSRQMGGGVRQTVAATLAQARLDSLASLSCAQLVGGLSGYSTTRGVNEFWTVVDGRNTKTLTVTLTIPRRVQHPVYSTVIPCRD
jgi:prepilin-type N-terminal cleavage/methylation domain-containing protein